jgi:hypothetical protein
VAFVPVIRTVAGMGLVHGFDGQGRFARFDGWGPERFALTLGVAAPGDAVRRALDALVGAASQLGASS